MKKLMVAVILTASAAFAEGLHVGDYETRTVSVAAESTETRSPASVGTHASLYKTGEGELRLPASGVWQGDDFPVGVRQGVLTLTSDAVAAETPAVLANAAFHVSAKTGLVVSNGADGVEYAYEWSDVREAARTLGDASPRSYPWAQAKWDPYSTKPENVGVAPTVVQQDDGVPALYFGGYASGKCMRWKNADGTDADIKGITDLFFVVHPVKTYGYMVSSADNPSDLQAVDALDFKLGYWNASGHFALAANDNAVMRRNGIRIDPNYEPVVAGRQILDMNFQFGRLAHAGVFCSDRFDRLASSDMLKGRCGGDCICEVIVFTNALTAAERAAVTKYLADGWNVKMNPTVDVTLAEGASLRLDIAEGKNVLTPRLVGGVLEKTGAGDLVVGYDADPESAIRLKAGTLSLRGSTTLAASDATRLTVTDEQLCPVVASSSAAAGTVVKDGDGTLRLGALPAETKELQVEGGVLAIGSADCGASGLVPGSETSCAVTNFSFELIDAAFATKPSGIQYFNNKSATASSQYGWYGKWNPKHAYDGGSGVGYCYSGDQMIGSAATPDGKWALAIKGDYSAWTFFEVTTPGRYAVSFKTGGRNTNANRLEVLVGSSAGMTDPDPETLTLIGCVNTRSGEFVLSRFLSPTLDAGTYTLYFRSPNLGNDRVAAIDDVHIDLVPLAVDDGTVNVPYGDFEAVDGACPSTTTKDTKLVGWTIDQRGTFVADANGGSVMAAVTDTRYNASYPRYYASEDAPSGRMGLLFASTGGLATTTFVPPEGTWRLRCRARRHCLQTSILSGGPNLGSAPQLEARIGGESLGFLDVSGSLMVSCGWPESFAADGETAVTLTLEQQAPGGYLVIDDLVLEPVMDESEPRELIADGSFENGTAWTFFKNETIGGNTLGKSTRMVGSESPNLWGGASAGFDGQYVWRVTQIGAAVQRVTVPEAGVYRLKFRALSRMDGSAKGNDPIRAWLTAAGGGAETNAIARTDVTTTNYVTHVFYVKLAAGEYDFGLQGCNDVDETGDNDRSACVDCVSLRRVSNAERAPELPEDLVVKVKAGSKLSLDFDGEAVVGGLRLGGRNCYGTVSAQTHPDFISGPGRIRSTAERPGLILLFR